MISAKKFTSINEIENGYLIKADKVSFKLIFLSDAVVRIRASFDGKFEEASYLLTKTAWQDKLDDFLKDERKRITALKIANVESDKEIVFSTKEMRVVLTKDPFTFAIYDNEGTCLHHDLKTKSYVQDHLGRSFHYQIRDIKKDRYYGFGEKTGSLNKAGRRMRFASKDSIGYDSETSDCLYKHIPFYIKMNKENRKAIGIFYHNTYESFIDLGSEISGYHASSPTKLYSYFGTEGGDLDLFYMVGPSISKIVGHYTDLTGKNALMPLNAFGYQGSTMYYTELAKNCDDEVLNFVKKTKSLGINMDGFFLSSGYTVKDGKRYVFYWNKERFSDPAKFFKQMSEAGLTVSANIKPGVLTTHPFFSDFKDSKVFVKTKEGDDIYLDRWWGGEGAFFDFTHPNGRDFWKKHIKTALIDNGCMAIWNDNNEYDSIEDKEATCHKDGMGGNIAELKPVMANIMAKCSYDAIKEHLPNMRPYITTRAGAAGIGRYAQTWCGDNLTEWKTIKYNISTLLGMGLSGMAHSGGDVGGFWGDAPSDEMFLRWVQSAIFYPRFSIHSANTDNSVTEPFMYENVANLIKKAIDLRYSLIPYFYSLNVEAFILGEPILRPMIYHFQHDTNIDNESDQFMLGRALLCCPVMEQNQTSKQIYLPYGEEWIDLATGKKLSGGYYNYSVDLTTIPMFLRAGEILSTSTDLNRLDTDRAKNLTLHSYPSKNGSFRYHEDDYTSNNYLKGEFLATHIDVERKGDVVYYNFKKEGNFKTFVENILVVLYNDVKAPLFAKIGNDNIPVFLDKDKFDASETAMYYNHDKKAAFVKFKNPSDKAFTLTVSFGIFDIIGNEKL